MSDLFGIKGCNREIKNEIRYLSSSCSPIYMITIGSNEAERVVYFGKVSSSNEKWMRLFENEIRSIVPCISFLI